MGFDEFREKAAKLVLPDNSLLQRFNLHKLKNYFDVYPFPHNGKKYILLIPVQIKPAKIKNFSEHEAKEAKIFLMEVEQDKAKKIWP